MGGRPESSDHFLGSNAIRWFQSRVLTESRVPLWELSVTGLWHRTVQIISQLTSLPATHISFLCSRLQQIHYFLGNSLKKSPLTISTYWRSNVFMAFFFNLCYLSGQTLRGTSHHANLKPSILSASCHLHLCFCLLLFLLLLLQNSVCDCIKKLFDSSKTNSMFSSYTKQRESRSNEQGCLPEQKAPLASALCGIYLCRGEDGEGCTLLSVWKETNRP